MQIECESFKVHCNSENLKYIHEKFTIWDFIEINESMTIKEFIEYLFTNYKVNITSISINNLNIYDSKTKKSVFEKNVEEAYNFISKNKLEDNKRFLMIDIQGTKEYTIAKMPRIKYIFK